MADFIIGAVVVIALGIAIRYIYKAKKSGVKCIGCPSGATCNSKSCGCCSGCQSDAETDK